MVLKLFSNPFLLKAFGNGARSQLTFPTAIKNKGKDDNSWQEYIADADIKKTKELYFGGLESIGFGRTNVTLYEGLN
jgi:CRISPR/Cas system CMR subunit Cmr4 (Cas7 group RAMP superfamily)